MDDDDADKFVTTTKTKKGSMPSAAPKKVVMDEDLLNPLTAQVRCTGGRT